MSSFFQAVETLARCATVFCIVFVILLAMPQSRLRSVCVEIAKYAFAALCCGLILSPLDIVPDFLVGPGQIDDLGYLIAGTLAIRSGIKDHRERHYLSR